MDDSIVDNLEICKVKFFKKDYIIINETIEGSEIIQGIVIYEDDTNQIVLNKIANKMKCPSDEIFAWYESTDNNIHPIGFNYTNNSIKNKDSFEKNKDIIDPLYVNSDGNKISNRLLDKYNELFEYNLDNKDNTIYFKTLFKFLENKGIDIKDTVTSDGDIKFKRYFYGVINKYWPQITDIRYINDYSNKELIDKRKEKINKDNKYLKTYDKQFNELYNIFTEGTTKTSSQKDDFYCNKFVISFMNIKNPHEKKNRVKIIKLFRDIELNDTSNIHFTKLSLSNHTETYYKFNKEKLSYNGNNSSNMIDEDICDKWIKGHSVKTSLGFQGYKYLHSKNVFVMKIYIEELSSENFLDKYITLAIHRDGDVDCIIDTNVSQKDITIIINTCNTIIEEFNIPLVTFDKYSENNIPLVTFENDLLSNINSKTKIINFNCELFISFLDKKNHIIKYDANKFRTLLSHFNTFIRLEESEGNQIEIQYKKVNNYESEGIYHTLIAKYSDPDLNLLPKDIIDKLIEQFNISLEKASQVYDDWRNIYERNIREGNNILKKHKDEPGVKITINQIEGDLRITLEDVNSYQDFKRIIIFIETIVYIYKNQLKHFFDSENDSDEQGSEGSYVSDEPLNFNDSDQDGGGKKDIDGPKNYFFEKLKKYNPEVYTLYGWSKSCSQTIHGKQPVIITRTELKRILKSRGKPYYSGEKSFTNIIKSSNIKNHGTGMYDTYPPGKNGEDLYFISPKYWDIKQRLSISEEAIKNGYEDENGQLFRDKIYTPEEIKSGKIIKGKSILERNSTSGEWRKDKVTEDIVDQNKMRVFSRVFNSHPQKYDAVCCKKFTKKDNDGEWVWYKHYGDDFKSKVNEQLREMFAFVADKGGTISIKEVNLVIQKQGVAITKNEVDKIFTEVGGGSEKIVFKKFVQLMTMVSASVKEDVYVEEVLDDDEHEQKYAQFYNGFEKKKVIPDVQKVISMRTPALKGKYAHLHKDLNLLFKQNMAEIEKTGGFIKIGVDQNTITNEFEIPAIFNAYYETLEDNYHSGYKSTTSSENLYYYILQFIMSNEQSLSNYLKMGNSRISYLFKRNMDEIKDGDILSFKNFLKDKLKKKQLISLNIKIDDILNDELENMTKDNFIEFINKNKSQKWINEFKFAFDLIISRKYYIEYLSSNEKRDDKYIIPLLDIYNPNVQILVFENIDDTIQIKSQFIYDDIDDNEQYRYYSFIYKKDNIYEPIIRRIKDKHIEKSPYDIFASNKLHLNDMYTTGIITNIIENDNDDDDIIVLNKIYENIKNGKKINIIYEQIKKKNIIGKFTKKPMKNLYVKACLKYEENQNRKNLLEKMMDKGIKTRAEFDKYKILNAEIDANKVKQLKINDEVYFKYDEEHLLNHHLKINEKDVPFYIKYNNENTLDINKHNDIYMLFITNFLKIKKIYINSYHNISHIITEKNLILPLLISFKKFKEICDRFQSKIEIDIIYDLEDEIGKSNDINNYITLTNNYMELIEDNGLSKSFYFKDYKIIGVATETEILDGKEYIVNLILKNGSYIPIKVEYSDKYNLKKIYNYDLYKIEKSIRLDETFDKSDKDYKKRPDKRDEFINKINDKKHSKDKFHKSLYQYIKDKEYVDKIKYKINNDDTYINESDEKQKFIIFHEDDDHNQIIKKYTEDNLGGYEDEFDVYGIVKNIVVNDENDVNEIQIEMKYIDKIICIINSFKINEDKRNELFIILKDIDFDNEIDFEKFKDLVKKIKMRYILEFIDLLLINKSDNFENLNSILEGKIDVRYLNKCSNSYELCFNKIEYGNGALQKFFYENSIYIRKHEFSNETKPVISLLKTIPDYIKKYFDKSEVISFLKKNDIGTLSVCLESIISGINEKKIKEILIKKYQSKVGSFKSIQKLKKYNTSFDKDNFKEDLKDPNYSITPIDLSFLFEEFEEYNFAIILLTKRYSSKHEMMIYNRNLDVEMKCIILYHQYIDKDDDYKLGYIKVNDKIDNSLKQLYELSDKLEEEINK